MSSDPLNNDSLLRQLGGCGAFQVVTTSLVSLSYVVSGFSLIFMSYGLYSPGWRCLDNITITNKSHNHDKESTKDIWRLGSNQTSSEDFTDTCDGFDSCQHIQFNPESSTIASEWGLICDRTWIASAIICMQMSGITIGSIISGYLGDAYGRKFSLMLNLFLHAVFNLLSVFSVSWEMFAVIRFFLGVSNGVLFSTYNVYTAEFVTPKWRIVTPSLPMWCVGCILLSVCAVLFKDWRYIHIFNSVLSIVCLLPLFILPESMRWLMVKSKEKKALNAVKKIAKMNRVEVPKESCLSLLATRQEVHEIKSSKVSFLGLFGKSNLKFTLILGANFLFSNIIYFATSFGTSALPGDIYVNNLIIFATELPANFFAWIFPNIFGRRPSTIGTWIVLSASLFLVVVFDFLTHGIVKKIGMLCSIIVARICTDICWMVMTTSINELYLTVIRSAASGWQLFTGGIGGILGPFLIPLDVNASYIFYLCMAVISILCAFLIVPLPETLGKDLEDDMKTTDHDNDRPV